jgi:hypothetical protein
MLRIDRVTPLSGWPGTLLTIDGQDFSSTLDNNQVLIGGVEALVVRATPNQLQVIAGEGTPSGNVEIRVSGFAPQIWPNRFEVSEWPDLRDARTAGPPLFFAGPQHSTPQVRQKDQRVLVILAHGKGDAPANPLLAAYDQSLPTEKAGKFWREASYGRTSFRFSYTNWLELPQDRHAYVWDNTDLEWARREYLMWTKRHAVAYGSTLLAVHQGFKLTDLDITNPAAPWERASVPNLGTPMHVATRGQIAYIASGADGIYVVNLAAPGGPAVVTTLTPPGRMMGCDVAGNVLAVAALDGGLHLYNITAPTAPVFLATHVVGDWATTVRLTPSRAYVGVGPSVVVVDISVPAFPNAIGAVPTEAWVMGLDVSGTTCVAATDGAGLVIIDVGVGGPTLAGKQLDILRLHAVSLSGTTAYTAAGAQGLHIVDVTNPVAPATRSTVITSRACYGVTIAGTRGWLSVGGKVIQPVDVTDPTAPLLGAEVDLTGYFLFGSDPDLTALRNNLTNAVNSVGKSKGDRLIFDAIEKAHATVSIHDPARYQGILVVILGSTGRAESKTTNQIDDGGRTLRFPEAKGVVWLPGDASWGRRAHEIGHWFGMRDIYEEQLDNGTFLRGTAAQWDMAGSHDQGPLFSGREALRMQLFETDNGSRASGRRARRRTMRNSSSLLTKVPKTRSVPGTTYWSWCWLRRASPTSSRYADKARPG